VVPVAVELWRKGQDFRRAELNAKAATLATVPINNDLAAELAYFGCCGSLRHSILESRGAFPELAGANCPTYAPRLHPEHSNVHFDRLIRIK
jgi:hypothetical protein